ncbi:hypothetical protein ACWD7M_16335 [Streptomyces griseus]
MSEPVQIDFTRRALAFNAVGKTLDKHRWWLPLRVRQAVANAVLQAALSVDRIPDESPAGADAAFEVLLAASSLGSSRAVEAVEKVPARQAWCERHPDAGTIGGMCAMCTQYGQLVPSESRLGPGELLRAAAVRSNDVAMANLLQTLADAYEDQPSAAMGLVSTVVHSALGVARQILSAAEGGRCICGDPIEWMTHPDGPGWIHSPGSDTRCLDARPTAAPPAPADRAAVLTEAADFVRALLVSRPGITTAGLEAELRTLAAEARDRWPDFDHRLIETATTVTEQPAAPAAPEETQ